MISEDQVKPMTPARPQPSRKWLGWALPALVSLLIVLVLVTLRVRGRAPTIAAPPDSEVEATLEHEGTTYKLYRGDLCSVDPETMATLK